MICKQSWSWFSHGLMERKLNLKNYIEQVKMGLMELLITLNAITQRTYLMLWKVNMAKEREKKGFTDYLGKMSPEARKAEELLKKYRLGKWNVGQQRGLVYYDKETYTRERGEMLAQLTDDVAGNVHDVVNEMRREIYDIEKEDEADANNAEDMEAMDIHGLGDDYMDGVYYEEDREETYE